MRRGRRIPWTHSRASAYMYNNPKNKYAKHQTRKEYRRFLKNELREEVYDTENS